MHRRAVRLGVLALLLAAGAAAAVMLWDGDERLRGLDERRRTVDALLEATMPAAADVAAAQKAYADYGLRDEATLARVGERLQQIRTQAARLRSSDQSATAHLEEIWASLAALTAAQTQAGEQLAAGESLRAADLLLGSSPQQHAATLAAALAGFREAELQAVRTQRDQLDRRSRALLAIVATLWIVGLVALARSPRAANAELSVTASAAAEGVPAVSAPVLAGPEGLVPPESPPPSQPAARTSEPPAIDLEAAAAVCDAIARLSDTGSLTGILERTARLLDARGIIIWMGAGEELFAAAAFGYDAAVMERLRPIPRTADNATAATWRTGQPRTVSADGSSLGAIVAPMCGPTACVGVFAAEVRSGRESDAPTRALAGIFAAQLAGVLAAWPAASTSETAPRIARPLGAAAAPPT